MYTQIITPTQKKYLVDIPDEMIGRSVKLTIDDFRGNGLETDKPQFSSVEEVYRHFTALRLDLRGFKFDREEANRRRW